MHSQNTKCSQIVYWALRISVSYINISLSTNPSWDANQLTSSPKFCLKWGSVTGEKCLIRMAPLETSVSCKEPQGSTSMRTEEMGEHSAGQTYQSLGQGCGEPWRVYGRSVWSHSELKCFIHLPSPVTGCRLPREK